MPKTTFAERLRQILTQRGITQSEFSAKTKIPKSAVSQYLKGNFEPKQDRLFIMAKVLGVDEAWLMGYEVPQIKSDNLSLGLFGEEHPIINEIVDDLLLLDDEEIYEIKGYVKSVKNRKDRG